MWNNVTIINIFYSIACCIMKLIIIINKRYLVELYSPVHLVSVRVETRRTFDIRHCHTPGKLWLEQFWSARDDHNYICSRSHCFHVFFPYIFFPTVLIKTIIIYLVPQIHVFVLFDTTLPSVRTSVEFMYFFSFLPVSNLQSKFRH